MGRLYRPESEKPAEGDVAEDPVQYGRIYVDVDGDAEDESEAAGTVTVTEPAPGDPPPSTVVVEEPKGNATTEEWSAFAIQSGATPEDLVDKGGEPLGRDALREKYATPSE